MAGEKWAQRIVERDLKRTTVVNDDNSEPSMYDLRVGPPHAPEIAIECFEAVDPDFTETWSIGAARGPLKLAVKGNWIVETSPTARIKNVKKNIEAIIQELENRQLHNVVVDFHLQWHDSTLFDKLTSLQVTHACCYETVGSGKVQLGLPGTGGAVDPSGTAVPVWIGRLLRESKYEDVLRKLDRSAAPNRHAFVFVGFSGAPWEVEGYLTGDIKKVPSDPPELPPSVTGVWIASQTGHRGIRWDANGWQLFEAH
jgi:hypothetical protein